ALWRAGYSLFQRRFRKTHRRGLRSLQSLPRHTAMGTVRPVGGDGPRRTMNDTYSDHAEIRDAVARLCAKFDGAYWRGVDTSRAYPTEFVDALTAAGFLGALIPEEYGGSGQGITVAAAILEEIHRSGGNAAACHAQMYTMGTILRRGTPAQKERYL